MKKLFLIITVILITIPNIGYALTKTNTSMSPGSLQGGLQGYWHLNEGIGTTAYDVSPNQNTATFIGSTLPTWGPGKILPYAVSCPGGTANSVDGGSSSTLRPTTAGTFSGWIKPSSTGSFQTFMSNGNMTGSESNGLNFYFLSNKLLASFNNGSGGGPTHQQQLAGVTTISTGVWYFVTVTWDSTTINLYLNGVLENSAAETIVPSPTSNFKMCSDGNGTSGAGYSGLEDEVRVYNRALTVNEITTLYRQSLYPNLINISNIYSSSGLANGLLDYWTFNGKYTNWATGLITDLGSANNSGQMGGMSTSTSPIQGKVGQAFNFDGSPQYIQTASNSGYSLPSQTFSAAFWMKPGSNGGGGQALVATSIATNPFDGIWIQYGPGFGSGTTNSMIVGEINTSVAGFWAYTNTGSVPTGSWIYVVTTYDGSASNAGVKIYLNGQLAPVTTGGTTSLTGSFTNRPWVIASEDSHVSAFTGVLDDVRIYNRVLSQSEITTLYKNQNYSAILK